MAKAGMSSGLSDSDLSKPLLGSESGISQQVKNNGKDVVDVKVDIPKSLPPLRPKSQQLEEAPVSPTSPFFKDGVGGESLPAMPTTPMIPVTPEGINNELGPDFNPFDHDVRGCGPVPTFEGVFCLPLVALRIALLLVLGIVVLPLFFIPLIGVKDPLSRPFAKWRRALLWPARFCARVFLFCLGYQWIHMVDRPAPRHVAPIVVSNHLSFIDPVFCFYYLLPIIISAKENADIFMIGTLLKACQIIPVDRKSVQSRQLVTKEILARAKDDRWPHIMIFPEGTTTNGRAIVSFKLGAFTPGVPVQPMVVKYPGEEVHPAWVRNGPTIQWILFRLMFRFHNRMTVKFLPVMSPTATEIEYPHLFANRVRTAMATELGVPVTTHSFWGDTREADTPRGSPLTGSPLPSPRARPSTST